VATQCLSSPASSLTRVSPDNHIPVTIKEPLASGLGETLGIQSLARLFDVLRAIRDDAEAGKGIGRSVLRVIVAVSYVLGVISDE